VEQFSRALMKRYMHPTLRALKSLPDDIEGDLLMGAANRLFDLDAPNHEASNISQLKGTNEHPS
ncbi:MAG: glutamyl-tRNA reductase, partial [Mariprofundus sp.]|nr:glutamyl-tRNA reductase [Mariprofundus sp.]